MTLRFDAVMLERLDVWRAQQKGVPSRQDAVRMILDERLARDGIPEESVAAKKSAVKRRST